MKMVNVYIKQIEGDSIVKTFECVSQRHAEQVARGAEINLNHKEFYVEVEEY